jgi:hypothetical protein
VAYEPLQQAPQPQTLVISVQITAYEPLQQAPQPQTLVISVLITIIVCSSSIGYS